MKKIAKYIPKIKSRLWRILIKRCKSLGLPYLPYKSYWHSKTSIPIKCEVNQYFTAVPNRGAGIGHQMANWIAGYWFAQQFNLKFAHTQFSKPEWELFLGFGEAETKVNDLLNIGYKQILLPLFDENNIDEINLIKIIINSYRGRKIIFRAEQDQFYKDQYGVMNAIKQKFYSSPSRVNDKILYKDTNYNIAVHVRRGDILSDPNNPNLKMRFLANEYYANAIKEALTITRTDKPIHIWIFSQGEKSDYEELNNFDNLHWCLDMDPYNSFAHLVFADLLITSKSSFSYKPALISNGIKMCPKNFWHSYPSTPDWILTDDYGYIIK